MKVRFFQILSPNKTPRSSYAVNFTKCCFVSGQGGSEDGQLLSCRPETFSKHVRELSESLCDARVLAKLNEGDTIAIEVICYKNSLTNFYNKF